MALVCDIETPFNQHSSGTATLVLGICLEKIKH